MKAASGSPMGLRSSIAVGRVRLGGHHDVDAGELRQAVLAKEKAPIAVFQKSKLILSVL